MTRSEPDISSSSSSSSSDISTPPAHHAAQHASIHRMRMPPRLWSPVATTRSSTLLLLLPRLPSLAPNLRWSYASLRALPHPTNCRLIGHPGTQLRPGPGHRVAPASCDEMGEAVPWRTAGCIYLYECSTLILIKHCSRTLTVSTATHPGICPPLCPLNVPTLHLHSTYAAAPNAPKHRS